MKILANALLSVSLTLVAVGHAVAQAPAPAAAQADEALKALATQISAHWKAKEWAQAEALTRQYIAATPPPPISRLRDLRSLLSLQGKTDEAVKLGLEIVKRKDALSADHNSVCWNFLLQNQALQARPYCETAVKLKDDNFAALVNLGHTYLLAGDAAAAQPWYARTLVSVPTEKELKEGPLDDFNLFIKNGWQTQLSNTYQKWFSQGWPAIQEAKAAVRQDIKLSNENKPVEALIYSIKAFELRQQWLGADHPDTLTSMNNLASTYSALGQHDKALAMNDKVLAARQTKLGADHPDTLTSMRNLAITYTALGQHDKALAMNEKVLAARQTKLGADHPNE